MSITSFKVYKAFGEDSDESHDERFARHLVISPVMAFPATSERSLNSDDKFSLLTSNSSVLLSGAGGGRSVPSSLASDISLDGGDLVNAAAEVLSESSHPRRMSLYLHQLDEGLPPEFEHSAQVVIAARQYVVADPEKATPAATRKRIVLKRGMGLLIAALFAFVVLGLAQAFSFNVPDLFTDGLILLVLATLIIVLAL